MFLGEAVEERSCRIGATPTKLSSIKQHLCFEADCIVHPRPPTVIRTAVSSTATRRRLDGGCPAVRRDGGNESPRRVSTRHASRTTVCRVVWSIRAFGPRYTSCGRSTPYDWATHGADPVGVSRLHRQTPKTISLYINWEN